MIKTKNGVILGYGDVKEYNEATRISPSIIILED